MTLLNLPAPDFSLPDIDGRIYRLADARGRVAVVYFWSGGCGWCTRIEPELQALLDELGGRVALYTIASGEHGEHHNPNGQPAPHQPTLLDPTGETAQAYGAKVTPHFSVVDETGILRYRGAFDDVSFRKRTREYLYLPAAIEAVLAGLVPDPAHTEAHGCAI